MIIRNNGSSITITTDGGIKIGDKVYYDINGNLRNIKDSISPLLNPDNSISYKNIPIYLRKRLNKSLSEIYDNLKADSNSIIALSHLHSFGLLEEKKINLQNLQKKINSSLYKLGLNDLDRFYFENKKSKLNFVDGLNLNDKVNYEAINKYVTFYKENKINNFKTFSEALQDFGIKNQNDILKYYNDNIDSSFKLDSKEFGLISFAKRDLINLQNRVIEDAISLGLDIPSDLPRFVAPSDKIKDETINPAKIKLIQSLDFTNNSSYKNEYFNHDHSLSNELKKKFIKDLKTQEKIINIDTNDNLELLRLQVLNNNGFSFKRIKDWALNNQSEILGPQKAMIIAQSGLKYCNKLVECGILKTSNYEDFTFSSPRAREILLENQSKSFNELADLIISEFKQNKTIDAEDNEAKVDKSVVSKQKKEFFDFLNAQYESFYKTQGIDLTSFKNDIAKKDSAEFKRLNDLYPALKILDFNDLINEYHESKKYIYDRTPKLNFTTKKTKDKLSEIWADAQNENRNKSDKDLEATINFINISAVRFNGINLDKLNKWKENVSLPDGQAESFVEASIAQAKELVNIGVLKTNDNENFVFSDDFAKEILFKNYNKSISEIEKENFGIKKIREEYKEVKPNNKDEKKSELTSFMHNGNKWEVIYDPDVEFTYSVFRNGKLHEDNLKLSDVFFDNELANSNFPIDRKEKEKALLEKYVTGIPLQESQKVDSNIDVPNIENNIDDKNNIKIVPKNKEKTSDITKQDITNQELITRFLTFNHSYEKSSNERYISLMKNEEYKLNTDIENKCLKDSVFREELNLLCKSDDIDANKYFYLSNLLDGLESKEQLRDLKNSENLNIEVN